MRNAAGGSEVVRLMQQRSRETWRAWRKHIEQGTADSKEAVALYEESRLAGATLLSELAARAEIQRSAAP